MAFRRIQTSFTAGQLDPKLRGRLDVGQYYAGAEILRNVLVQPQGGVTRRHGTAHVDELLHRLTLLVPTTPTAPNGGDVADLFDDDPGTVLGTTDDIGTENPYVVASYDLGAATVVDYVDVRNFRLTEGETAGEFKVEHSTDGAAWTALGSATIDTDIANVSHRFATGGLSRRYWRLARIGATDLGGAFVEIAEFNLWAENALLSAAREVEFEFSLDQIYLLVFTDRAISVYRDGVFKCVVNSPYPTAAVGTITWSQTLDSMIIAHEDYPTQLLQRQGADDAWQMQAIAFRATPYYRFVPVDSTPFGTLTPSAVEGSIDLTLGSPTKEISSIRATNPAEITVELHGWASTNSVTLAGTNSTPTVDGVRTITKIDDNNFTVAVNLSAGTPGNTGTARLTSASTFVWTSAHVGQIVDGNGGRARITGITSGSVAKAVVLVPFYDGSAVASGDWTLMLGYESAWSAARGYPRAVCFHDERLFLGGSTELPSHLWGSGVGPDRVFDFSLGQSLDDDGLDVTLPASEHGVPTIMNLYSGRNLQIFCSNQERFIPQADSTAITPSTIRTKRATSHGIRAGLPPVEVGGAILFVQRQGKALRELLFVDSEQSYAAKNISLLSSPLIKSPVDIALRAATSTDEADLAVIVNGDGTLAFLTTLRDQEIAAWSSGDTRAGDKFLNAEAIGSDIYYITERTVDGVLRRFIERADPDLLLDCATTGGAASSVVVSSAIYTDETVDLILDGMVQAERAFDGNTLTFPRAAASSYELGYDFTTTIKDMPVADQAQDGSVFGLNIRIIEAVFEVFETTHMMVNGLEVAFQNFGEAGANPLDTTAPEFTGRKTLEGFLGYDKYGQLTITQDVPAKLTVLVIGKKIKAA